MLPVHVVRLPADLKPTDLVGRAVVVFDVLRATSTVTMALHHGAVEVRAFGSLDEARAAWERFASPKLLAGEKHCLPPAGFEIGNSSGDFTADRVGGRTVFLSTTNGTRAILAAAEAARLFTASLLNASATAYFLAEVGLPVTLICSGTEGQFSEEDFLGAGAVTHALNQAAKIDLSDDAVDALRRFELAYAHDRLAIEMRKTISGHNLRLARLEKDIDFAAQLDVSQVVAEVTGVPPVIRSTKLTL